MIDVYATEGTFSDKHTLAQNLAQAVMRWEQVPEIQLFSDNTAAFVHDLPAEAIANAACTPYCVIVFGLSSGGARAGCTSCREGRR